MKAKKIALVGPESSGKTTLCKELAMHFNCSWVPEFAREYLEARDGQYDYNDLVPIAKGQKESEATKADFSKRFIFYDTNLLTIKIWSDIKYGQADCWINDNLEQERFDLHLLCKPDLKWKDDPLRESKDQLDEIFEQHVKELDYYNLRYEVVKGLDAERFQNALRIVSKY